MWDSFLEMEIFLQEKEINQGAMALGFLPSRRLSSGSVFQWCGLGGRMSKFHRVIFPVLCGHLELQWIVQFGVSGASSDHHGHSPWVNVELLDPARCLAGAYV